MSDTTRCLHSAVICFCSKKVVFRYSHSYSLMVISPIYMYTIIAFNLTAELMLVKVSASMVWNWLENLCLQCHFFSKSTRLSGTAKKWATILFEPINEAPPKANPKLACLLKFMHSTKVPWKLFGSTCHRTMARTATLDTSADECSGFLYLEASDCRWETCSGMLQKGPAKIWGKANLMSSYDIWICSLGYKKSDQSFLPSRTGLIPGPRYLNQPMLTSLFAWLFWCHLARVWFLQNILLEWRQKVAETNNMNSELSGKDKSLSFGNPFYIELFIPVS